MCELKVMDLGSVERGESGEEEIKLQKRDLWGLLVFFDGKWCVTCNGITPHTKSYDIVTSLSWSILSTYGLTHLIHQNWHNIHINLAVELDVYDCFARICEDPVEQNGFPHLLAQLDKAISFAHTTSPYSWNRKHVIWRSHLSGEAHSSQDHSVFIPNHALPISSHPTQKLRAKSLP